MSMEINHGLLYIFVVIGMYDTLDLCLVLKLSIIGWIPLTSMLSTNSIDVKSIYRIKQI